VVAEVTRIISDLHYGDPASRVRSLDALQPLFSGADRMVFNGDSVETRRNPIAHKTDQIRGEFLDFARSAAPGCTIVAGSGSSGTAGSNGTTGANGVTGAGADEAG